MGIEFLETTKRSVKKGWDKAKQKLSVADLFTIRPDTIRTLQFLPCDGGPANPSELYILKVENNQIGIYVDNFKIGMCDTPPKSIVQEMKENHNIAIGRFYRESAVSGQIELEVGVKTVKDVEDTNEQ